MARRLFLHVGPPKSGTSYLQMAWFQHRQELAADGVLFPGNQRLDHFRASAVVLDKSWVVKELGPGQRRAWDRLTSEVAAWEGDAILSSEHYATAGTPRARRIVEQLREVADEVHVMITARDLARQIPSAWQQRIKTGSALALDDFWRELAADDDHRFWRAQDLARLADRWGRDLPNEHVHLVVHAPPGAAKGLLWERVCEVTGVDPSVLGPVHRANESLGVVQVELLRRVNAHVPREHRGLAMSRATKSLMARHVLSRTGTAAGFGLSEEALSWVVERSSRTVAELSGRGYHVVGDLADLVPQATASPGRDPGTVTDTELADLAAEAFATVLVREVDARKQDRRLRRQVRRLRRQLRTARSGQAGPVRRLAARLRR